MGRPERLDVLTGHEEFILGDAVDGVTNAAKCDESSLLIVLRGNPYEIGVTAVAHRSNLEPPPIHATFLGTPHDVPLSDLRFLLEQRGFYQSHGCLPRAADAALS